MKIQQHDGVVVDAAGLRQGFAKQLREAPRLRVRLPSLPLLYIGPQGGHRPWRWESPKGTVARGVEWPPRQVVRPPP